MLIVELSKSKMLARFLCLTVFIFMCSFSGCNDTTPPTVVSEQPNESARGLADQVVEASCGQCQFGVEGSGCDLAIRFKGKIYFVDGSDIDDHGDAHAGDGLCNCVHSAVVSGEIKDERFVATSFELQIKENSNTD
ncbi:MAG: DUF6370 family protein [Mariniblastus sp.]